MTSVDNIDLTAAAVDIDGVAMLPSTGAVGDLTGVTGNLKWGIAPDQLLNEAALTNAPAGVVAQTAAFDSGLDAGDTIYYQFWLTQGAVYAPISGIYAGVLT